jgi:hypothetical protein
MAKGEPMSDMMTFPDTVEEFMEQYKIVDDENVYTNGADLVPIFRMVQWFEHVSATDTISRQAAIDALNEVVKDHSITDFDAIASILDLPSAQPEIIRCKDCKHWIPYDWMFSEVWQSKNIADYPEDEIGCNFCDVAMKANDFCSRGERRENG